MNETEGRNLDTEPKPERYLNIDMVHCEWKDKRITLHEAQSFYSPTSVFCKTCKGACQEQNK
jgi:hypothetical protein